MAKSFTVEKQSASLRLDVFLKNLVSDVSREKIKRAILAGQVAVAGEIVTDPSKVLREGQVVELHKDIKPYRLEPEPLPLKKVYEDDDFLVIDKPAGLVIHPGANVLSGTLAHALLAEYPEMAEVGDSLRPGIVHRLDKETSGLVLVAKNTKAFDYAKAIFKNREITKGYEALVVGHLPKKQGTINKPLSLRPERRRVEVSREGKPALTEYQVLALYQESIVLDPHAKRSSSAKGIGAEVDFYTLVRIILHTGRTHQIRVHFSSEGFPVAGDGLYGRGKPVPEGLERQFLHAKRLTFKLPNGTTLDLESELPDDLKKVLDNLELLK